MSEAACRTRIEHLPAEELTRLLGQLGHEVGTPLGSILMLAEMLAESRDVEGVGRRAEGLKQAAREVRDVVQAFVRLVRLRTGWLSPAPSDVDAATMLGTLRMAASSHGVAVEASESLPEGLRLDTDYLRDAVELCCAWAMAHSRQASLGVGTGAGGLHCELRCGGRQVAWHDPAILDPLVAGDLRPVRRLGGPALALPLARLLTWRLGGALTGRFDETTGENVLSLALSAGAEDPLAA